VAVGDVHGAFDAFAGILQTAAIIDGKRQWAGGQTVFVQTGDIFDRGPGVKDALDLLMQLEDQAKRAGGRVEALLGNHEVMNILGDFRDVAPEIYAGFADARSEDRRKRAYDDLAKLLKRRKVEAPSREVWMASHPPGFLEYIDALGPRGKYGKWLRSHAVVVNVNGTAFMHAGINPDTATTLDDVNKTAAREIATWDDTKAALVKLQIIPLFATLKETVEAAASEIERIAAAVKANNPPGDHVTREFVDSLMELQKIDSWSLIAGEGNLWFRGFAQWPDTEQPKVEALLKRVGVERFVTAHTPQLPGRIKDRFGNRIFLIDTGMLSSYFKGGRASALEIQVDPSTGNPSTGPGAGRITAIYPDSREVLVPAGVAHRLRDFFGGASAAAASASAR
jgi:hypothetical protein